MRTCPVDGRPIEGRADRRYCSERCSKKARRKAAKTAEVVPIKSDVKPGRITREDSVRAELEAAGKEMSALGVSALELAARLDSGAETGSGLAALNRELRATLAEALKGEVRSSVSALRDELAERRARA